MQTIARVVKTINYFLLCVRRKEPYVSWAITSCGEGPKTSLEEANEESSAYLVRERDADSDGSTALRDHWVEIFEAELEAWRTDEVVLGLELES